MAGAFRHDTEGKYRPEPLERRTYRMKETYEAPEMEIIEFEEEDIITTSDAE